MSKDCGEGGVPRPPVQRLLLEPPVLGAPRSLPGTHLSRRRTVRAYCGRSGSMQSGRGGVSWPHLRL